MKAVEGRWIPGRTFSGAVIRAGSAAEKKRPSRHQRELKDTDKGLTTSCCCTFIKVALRVQGEHGTLLHLLLASLPPPQKKKKKKEGEEGGRG